jgi:dTDP-4-dehydrorhamnose reductase
MKKILITGASGYLGTYMCRKLSMRGTKNVYALYKTSRKDYPNINYIHCDLMNLNELSRIVEKIRPEIIYHLASVTPTRIGKKGNDYVEYINHFVTGHIARLCEELNTLLIYTSTDLVYKEGDNITEDSILEPRSVYAESKLNGEEVIESLAPRYVILRMSLIYGLTLSKYTTFYDEAYKLLKAGKIVRAFGDMYRKPIYVKDAVYNILNIPRLYEENIIMNFCGADYISRYDMCMAMAEAHGFDKNHVKKISCDEIPGTDWVKRIGLNNNLMQYFGLATYTFAENVYKAMKFKY